MRENLLPFWVQFIEIISLIPDSRSGRLALLVGPNRHMFRSFQIVRKTALSKSVSQVRLVVEVIFFPFRKMIGMGEEVTFPTIARSMCKDKVVA